MKLSKPYNVTTRQYEYASIAAIRFHYFSDMDQQTFAALFEERHIQALKELGFKGFRGYQNPDVVRYMIEVVGRIKVA